jgi:hypothetical protein
MFKNLSVTELIKKAGCSLQNIKNGSIEERNFLLIVLGFEK